MKPGRFRDYSLVDLFTDIIVEGLEGLLEEPSDLDAKTLTNIAQKLCDEIEEHMNAQFDKFREDVVR